ncbi:MAG: trigger factor [Pseudonocardiaceae bacterium]|nr:trigger factor [Pseudonocardiaceae bacterium]
MKSTVEQLSPTRVKINVEVPFDELKPNFDKAYKKIAQQVRIPGFRPGKAPPRILEQRLGRGVVLDEVVNEAVPAKYREALSSGEVQPLSQPEIEVTNMDEGDLLIFTAEVDVRPEITLPVFGELSVSVDDVEVTAEDIAEQLDGLRSRFGTLTGVNRPVEHGDFVVIDLSATVDGAEVPEAATTGLSYEVGSDELIEGIDDALIGVSEGEERTFTTKLVAGEHAGREAEVTVKLGSVKVRELPELDDEFAQLASEFDTFEELRGDVAERLARVKSMQQGMEARDKVLESLLAATDVPLPDKVVESEIEARKHDAVHDFEHDENRLGEHLEQQGQTREEFDAELGTAAEDAVKAQLVLDSIADAEEVNVDESELTERIVYQAQRYGVSPEEYVKQAQQAGQLGAIYADVRRGKALASVVRRAVVTDASGNTVDIEALFGHDAPATPEEAETDAPAEVEAPADVEADVEADVDTEADPDAPADARKAD